MGFQLTVEKECLLLAGKDNKTTASPIVQKSIRKDIQGLRCLAVSAVVLFHLWPKRILNGALGVDIFFVISGYLMKYLAAKNATIDTEFVKRFYYRRLRRLLPLYMLVVTAITTASRIMDSAQRKSSLREAGFAAGFLSNTFGLPEAGYFGVSNEYPLFLHTWSLSTEMQFYLFCPAILLVGRSVNVIPAMESFLYLALIVSSACAQLWFRYDENFSHMALICRLWQFIMGFMAYELEFDRRTAIRNFQIRTFFSSVLAIISTAVMISSPTNSLVADRFIVTISAALVIVIGETKVLEAKKFVWMGDCSYGVYLVHWPIFTIHKYLFRVDYNEYGPRFADGIVLIISAIYVGHLVEKTVSGLTVLTIHNWKNLSAVTILLYIIFGFSFYVLLFSTQEGPSTGVALSGGKLADAKIPDGFWGDKAILVKTVDIYKNSEKYGNWTNEEVDQWNLVTMEIPKLRVKPKLPTSFDYDKNPDIFYWVGVYEGEGSLEMVVVGNSWAANVIFAIYYHFRTTFRRLTLVGTNGCSIFTPDMPKDFKRKPDCEVVHEQIIPILNGWDRHIDVIIVHMYWGVVLSAPLNINDKYQRQMATFFGSLQNLQPLVIFTLAGHLRWNNGIGDFAANIKGRRIATRSWSQFKKTDPQWKIPHRVAALNCSICVPYKTMPAFCEVISDTCRFIDHSGRALYRDSRHLTQLGGLYAASVLKDSFDEWSLNINQSNTA